MRVPTKEQQAQCRELYAFYERVPEQLMLDITKEMTAALPPGHSGWLKTEDVVQQAVLRKKRLWLIGCPVMYIVFAQKYAEWEQRSRVSTDR